MRKETKKETKTRVSREKNLVAEIVQEFRKNTAGKLNEIRNGSFSSYVQEIADRNVCELSIADIEKDIGIFVGLLVHQYFNQVFVPDEVYKTE